MRILGIDPGYAIVGYGVIEAAGGRYCPLEYGAITTPAGVEFGRRLEEIYQGMGEILTRLRPEAAAVEKLYFTNNKTTGIGVAEARGVILLALAQAGVPLYEYTPHAGKAGCHRLRQGFEAPSPRDDPAAAMSAQGAQAGRHGRCAGVGHLSWAGSRFPFAARAAQAEPQAGAGDLTDPASFGKLLPSF